MTGELREDAWEIYYDCRDHAARAYSASRLHEDYEDAWIMINWILQ